MKRRLDQKKFYPNAIGGDPLHNVTKGLPTKLPVRRFNVGGKIVSVLPAVGFSLTFSQLRAEGKSVSEAGARALLDEGSLGCTELTVDMIEAIGEEYNQLVDGALEANHNLQTRQNEIPNGGEIPATASGRSGEHGGIPIRVGYLGG